MTERAPFQASSAPCSPARWFIEISRLGPCLEIPHPVHLCARSSVFNGKLRLIPHSLPSPYIYIFPFFNKSLFVLINYIEYKVYHFRLFKYRVQRHVVYAICPVQPSPGLRSFLFSPFIQHQLYFSLPNLGHGNNYSFFVFFKKIIFMYLYVYVKQTYAHGGQRYGDPLGLES